MECNHSTFDAHVTIEMLEMTHRFYNSYHRNHNSEIQKYSRMTLINKCQNRNGDRYKIVGTRMSGDVDTSLGNSLINYAILKEAISIFKVKGDVIVNGDDSIIFLNEPIQP